MNAESSAHVVPIPAAAPSTGAGATLAFLCHELRRHLPAVVVAWVLMLLVPLIHRVSEGRWRYFENDWNVVAGLFACLVVAPLLAFILALGGWATERQTRTLEWLYARPLSAARLFGLRVLAILISVAVFCAVSLAANVVSPVQLADGLKLSAGIEVAAGAALLAGPIYVILALGLGLLTSALSDNPGAALARALLAAVALLILILGLWVGVPTRLAWTWVGRPELVVAGHVALLLIGMVSIFAAWWAVRHSPSDGRRWTRVLYPLVPTLVVLTITAVAFLLRPLGADLERVQRVVALDGAELRLAPASVGAGGRTTLDTPTVVVSRPFMLNHPVLVDGDGERRVLRRVFVLAEDVWPSPARDRVLVSGLHANQPGWMAIDASGEVTAIDPGGGSGGGTIGWSPGGRHFAWRSRHASGNLLLSILGPEGEPRTVAAALPAATAPWAAGWIDDRRLLVTPQPRLWEKIDPAHRPTSAGWWTVLGADGATVVEPRSLNTGEFFYSPILKGPEPRGPMDCGNPPRVPRFGERLYGFVTDLSRARLAAIDLQRGELEAVPGLTWDVSLEQLPRPILGSLGVTDDGALLWAEHGVAGTSVMRLAPGAEQASPVCRYEHLWPGWNLVPTYRGESGGWAVWHDLFGKKLYACHLASGRVAVHEEALGPRGACSVDLASGGALLTPAGPFSLDG